MTEQPSIALEAEVKIDGGGVPMNGDYRPENVQIYKDAAHIRQRPGMYIGNLASSGLHHLAYELVYNAVD